MRTALLIFLNFSWFVLSAQIKVNYKIPETREVIVYTNDSKIITDIRIAEPEKKFKVKNTLYYSWFKEEVILETKGGYKGNLLHGNYEESYPNKQLKQKGVFVNGVKDGEWLSWYENGELREITLWKKGIMEGEYKAFNDKGELIQTAFYKDGLLEGWKKEYSDGEEIARTKYKNGVEVKKNIEEMNEKELKKEYKKQLNPENKKPRKKPLNKRNTEQEVPQEPQKKENKIKA